jgi:hypothetical protein
LGQSSEGDPEKLIQQTAFRAGQLIEARELTIVEIKTALTDALKARCSILGLDKDLFLPGMLEQFRQGMAETYRDCYYIYKFCDRYHHNHELWPQFI